MKKLTSSLLAAAAFIASVSVVSADESSSKTGAYLGVSGGAANTNVKYSFTNAGAPYTSFGGGGSPQTAGSPVNAANTQANNLQAGNFGALFGLFAGYGMQMNSLYFGGEIYGGFDTSKVNTFGDSTGLGTGYGAAVGGVPADEVGTLLPSVNANIKRTMYYGIAPRFGGFITPSTLLYVKLGIEAGKWKAAVSNAPNCVLIAVGGVVPNGPWTASKNSISFAPGLGVEAYITKNLFMRAEYSYLFGPKVTVVQNTNGNGSWSGTYLTHTFKVTQQSFKVGVGYKF